MASEDRKNIHDDLDDLLDDKQYNGKQAIGFED
jgi:hypothetical protein